MQELRGTGEYHLLTETRDLAVKLVNGTALPASGSYEVIEHPGQINGMVTGGILLCHLRNALWSPSTGLVLLDGTDHIPESPLSQVKDPATAASHLKSAAAKHVSRGAIWVSGGSFRNYGHFLMDSLTGLSALVDLGISGSGAPYPAYCGALNNWQAGLTQAANLHSDLRETNANAIRFDELVYITTVHSYLQRNGVLLQRLIGRIQPQRPQLTAASESVYLSRRAYAGRLLVNEAALEAALQAKGVRIVQPEKLTPRQQIDLMATCRLLIGPSGAALGNLCFMPAGARVIELRPETVKELWLDLAAAQGGIHHQIIPMQAPLLSRETPLHVKVRQLPRRLLRRYHYACSVSISDVLMAIS